MKTTTLLNKISTNNTGSKELDTFADFQSKGCPLKQIQIRHGDIIDGMRFLYDSNWTSWCGSSNTGKEEFMTLAEGEYINRISGKLGSWFGASHIVQLTIYTTKGQSRTFGTGAYSSTVQPFDFNYLDSYILGFCIKSNYHIYKGGTDYISDIGIYYIGKEMEFISSLFYDYTLGKEKYKTIILETYRDSRVYTLVQQLTVACSDPSTVINDSMKWYDSQISKQSTDTDRYILKLAMLTFYNNRYKNNPIKENITSYGLMAVGKRIWQYNDLIAGDYLFPNLRFMPLSDNEFNAYDSSYETVKQSPVFSMLSNTKKMFRVGSSSLNDVTPVFKGTRKLQNSNYGLMSDSISDYPYEGTVILDKTKKNIEQALQWVIDNNVEVWLLPEMCMDQTALDCLKNLLQQNKSKLTNLKMIIPGSTYKKVGQKFSNQAPIWILDSSKNGVELVPYDKTVPFSMDTPTSSISSPDVDKIAKDAKDAGCNIIVEDIEQGISFRIVRVDCAYIGIAVCRDVLDLSDECNPLNRYCDFVDIMLVVSMNSGHTNCFTSTAESMARWHYCATIYNNNMTSVLAPNDKTVEMSFAIWPRVTSAAGIQGEIYYRSEPIINQLTKLEHSKELNYDSKSFMELCDVAVTSIYSKGVVAKAMPKDGNVFYDIKISQ